MVIMHIYINFHISEIIIIRTTAASVFLFIIKNIFNNYFDPYPISWLQGWIARPRSEDLMSLCLSACFSAFFRAPVFFFGILSEQKKYETFFSGFRFIRICKLKVHSPESETNTNERKKNRKIAHFRKIFEWKGFWKFFRNQKMHINIFSDFND